MADNRAQHLAELRRLFESGVLSEAAYRAATAGLGETVEIKATVDGAGAAAQDHSAAAGAGGVAVAGSVHGSIYYGPPAQDPVEALRIYRRMLVLACCHLPLRGVDVGASDPGRNQRQLDLAQVYVGLDTTAQVVLAEEKKTERSRRASMGDRETRPLRVLEAAARERRLVVLGEPGSGKSTFVHHLALCLAAHGAEPDAGWLERLPDWPRKEADVVPILVNLRDFARWLPGDAGHAAPCHLWNFVVDGLKAQNLGFAAKPLHQALEEEGQAIVLLDGLDEIPTPARRTFVRDAVTGFAGRYPQSRVVVTCRTLSYQDPAWRLDGFPDVVLAPLDEHKIDRFIGAWYKQLSSMGTVRAEDAGGLAARLREAVRRPDLWRLASNPLLLTVMALVHTHKGRLPDARALLYEDTVDILLWRWEQIKAGGDEQAPRLRQLLLDVGRTDVDLKRVLWQLAFEAHGDGGAGDGETLADIGELRLQKALAGLHPEGSLDWAHRAITVIKMRAGLLLERMPEVYTLPHRTFQEYLAGAHLSSQANFAQQAAALVEEGAFWRVVVLLAVGRLVYLGGDMDKPLALVGELCPEQGRNEALAWQKAWLAGDALVEAGLNRVRDSALGRDLVERVRHRLADLVTAGRLASIERAAAGSTLARLGDPRFRKDAWFLPDEPLLGFVKVPAGSFTMGSDKDRDLEAYDDELPQHPVVLPTYYIARYPVTVAQFRAFVEDSGHEPGGGASLRGVDNHPVVNVTWHDAAAYCRWLAERLAEWPGTPAPLAALLREQGWRVRLPSEAEWEKAARGTDGRVYPWGEGIDESRANYAETGIGTTSAVGSFPGGASPYGVHDLSGNVLEWCATKWQDSYADYRDDNSPEGGGTRVLRGGAFVNESRVVRCACRGRDAPGYRLRNIGFRVVLSPGFPSDL